MNKEIQTGKYRHYKGKEYEVLGLAHHSESLELLVAYRALYNSEEFGNSAIWVRPFDMFIDKVNVDGKEIPRFEYIDK